jgi:hypothetical protein
LNDTHELYKSSEGALIRHQELGLVCTRLKELMDGADRQIKQAHGGSPADGQLIHLLDESHRIADSILVHLKSVQGKPGDGGWKTFRRVIASTVMRSLELKVLEERLENTRKQLDTALLISFK